MKNLLLSLALVAGSFAFFAPATAQAQDFGVRIGGGGVDIWIGDGYRGRDYRNCYPDYRRGGRYDGYDRCNPRYDYRAPITVQVVVGYTRSYDCWSRTWVMVPQYGYVTATWDARYGQYVYRDPMTGRLMTVPINGGGYRRW